MASHPEAMGLTHQLDFFLWQHLTDNIGHAISNLRTYRLFVLCDVAWQFLQVCGLPLNVGAWIRMLKRRPEKHCLEPRVHTL